MGRRAIVALLLAAVAVWGVVALTGRDHEQPAERPVHLLDDARSPVVRITVTDRATGRKDVLPDATVQRIAKDLSPLLAIRTFPTVRPEYGLDPPAADVVIETRAGPLPVIHVGETNFDRTGYYVTIDGRKGAALVLMRVGDALLAV